MKIVIFIIINIFEYIFSEIETIDFNGKNYNKEYTLLSSTIFSISNLPNDNYLYIKAENKSEINYQTALSFSLSDTSLKREQLSEGYEGVTEMWLKKEQLGENSYFITLNCSSYPCSQNFSLESKKTIELSSDNQLIYYVNQNNTKMEISFKCEESEKVDYLKFIIWLRGEKNINYDLEYSPKALEITNNSNKTEYYENTKIIQISKKSGSSCIVKINVAAEIGDLIQIGISKYTYNSDINFLSRTINENEREIIGFSYDTTKVCYYFEKNPMSNKKLLIGKIYEKYGSILQLNKTTQKFEQIISIINGVIRYNIENNQFGNYICIYNSNTSEIIYTIKYITKTDGTEDKRNYFSQKILLSSIPTVLDKGQYQFFQINNINENAQKLNYLIRSEFGYAGFYFYKCDNFPFCNFDSLNNLTKIERTQRQSSWIVQKEKELMLSPIDSDQNLIVVICDEYGYRNNTKNISYYKEEVCSFYIDLQTDDTPFILENQETINKFIIKNETDIYSVKNDKTAAGLLIDILLINGDIDLIENIGFTDKTINCNKYQMKMNNTCDLLNFKLKAYQNSFYQISIHPIPQYTDSEIQEIIEPGLTFQINYYETTETMYVHTELKKGIFLAIIQPVNNKFSVTNPKNEILNLYIRSFQEIITNQDQIYYLDQYIYYLQHEMFFQSIVAYLSFIEIPSPESEIENKLVILENIEQYIHFNQNISEIKLLYIYTDTTKDIIIKFNYVNTAKYLVSCYIGNYYLYKNIEMSLDEFLIIKAETIEENQCCKDKNNPCFLNIIIKFDGKIDNIIDNDSTLGITVNLINNYVPKYLEKNILLKDYLHNDYYNYYYSYVNFDSYFDIKISYYGGELEVYSSLLTKNDIESKEGGWKGKFIFPNKDSSQGLKYDYDNNLRTTSIPINTEECFLNDNCMILISIKKKNSSIEISNFNMYIYGLSIFSVLQGDIKLFSKDFSINNFHYSSDNYKKKCFCYTIESNAETILMNLQGNVTEPKFYLISKGGDIKIQLNYVKNSSNLIYFIDGNELINLAIENNINLNNENSTKGLNYEICFDENLNGIYIYNVTSDIFSILNSDQDLIIYEMNSYQKVNCEPSFINNEYRCLFIIIPPINKGNFDIILYPKLFDLDNTFEIYGDIIDKNIYKFNEYDTLKELIPNKNSNFTAKNTYLYINEINNNYSCIFISVVTSSNTIVELYSSPYDYKLLTLPNLYSPFIVPLKEASIEYSFPINKKYIVNIYVLKGDGFVYWNNKNENKYYLSGMDDNIYLTEKNETEELKLIINKSTEEFIYLISYNIKEVYDEIDELPFGKSNTFYYNKVQKLIKTFTRLQKIQDFDIFVSFHNNDVENNIAPPEILNYLCCYIVEEKYIITFDSPESSIIQNNSLCIYFDQRIKTGFLNFTSNYINSHYNLTDLTNTKYFIVLTIPKLYYTATIYPRESNIIINEFKYQYGQLSGFDSLIYKLRVDKKYMRIQFASNNNVNIHFKTDNNNEVVSLVQSVQNGRTIFILDTSSGQNEFIYLNINQNDTAIKYNNYVFNYINLDNYNNYQNFTVDGNINCATSYNSNNNKTKFTLTFAPVKDNNNKNSEQYNISYIIFFDFSNKQSNLNYDSIAFIKTNRVYSKQIYNFTLNEQGKIIVEFEEMENTDYNIQITVEIKNKNTFEYLNYKSIFVKKFENDNDNDNNDNIVSIIILCVVIALLIIGAVILIVYCIKIRKKNQELIQKVKEVSFSNPKDFEEEAASTTLLVD